MYLTSHLSFLKRANDDMEVGYSKSNGSVPGSSVKDEQNEEWLKTTLM